jgi:hypothetical protein
VKLASLVSPLALFAMFFPHFLFIGFTQGKNVVTKKFASLLPYTVFSFGLYILAAYEIGEVGIQSWSTYEVFFVHARYC